MKNFLLSAILLFSFVNAQSQVYGGPEVFTEDFNSGIPGSWTIIDGDGVTPNAYITGQGYTGQWQHFQHPGRNCAAVGSCGPTSDDYLVTPAIVLPSGQFLLSWKAASYTVFNPQNYEVRISTTTPDATGLLANPALQVVTGEYDKWTSHQLNISSYAGQTVYIGFRANSVGWSLFLDDVHISSPVSYDASIVSIDLPETVLPGAHTFSAQLWNAGVYALNSYTLNYSVNNGPATSLASGAVSIPGGSTSNFTGIPFTAAGNGTYLLKVWASALNSNGDVYTLNDTLRQYVFVTTTPKMLLVEEFTQAGCYPCGLVNPYFDSLLFPNLTAQKVAAIKYHSSWPGYDPMYLDNVPLSEDRVMFYDISAVPEALVDGVWIPASSSASYTGNPGDLTQADIDSTRAYPALYEMSVTNSTVASTTTVSVTVTAKTDVPMTEMHLYTVIIEDSVNFSGSNGEEVFYQVARQILPGSAGQLLPVMSANQSVTYTFTYPVTAVYDPTILRTVAFVTNDETRKVYQAAVGTPYPNPAGMNEVAVNYGLDAFPNPSHDKLTVTANGIAANEISWSLINVMGEMVLSGNAAVANGNFNKQLDLSTLPAGIYFFSLNDGSVTAVKKVVKN